MAVPAEYRGREQAFIKHTLLRRYLDRFGHKIGSKWDFINYVDCFAGSWQSSAADYSDTSFGIAVQQLQKARSDLAKVAHRSLALRFCFIESDPASFELLNEFATRKSVPGCGIKALPGEFEGNLEKIRQLLSLGGDRAFRFLLVDPKGWTGFALNRIAPLVNGRSAEVLVNLMTSFIRRFVTLEEQRPKFEELFGDARVADEAAALAGVERERYLVSRYAANLKLRAKFKFVTAAAVLRAAEDDVHYYLVFGTNSPHGVAVFKDAERIAFETGESVREEAKSRKRIARTGQPELDIFVEGLASASPYAAELRETYRREARQRLASLLIPGRTIPYDQLLGEVLETPLVWQQDLGDWLLEAVQAGQIEIPTLTPRKSLRLDAHYEIRVLK